MSEFHSLLVEGFKLEVEFLIIFVFSHHFVHWDRPPGLESMNRFATLSLKQPFNEFSLHLLNFRVHMELANGFDDSLGGC
jgi:hypothetical protein